MTAYAIGLPRPATGGPKFDRDRVARRARDWWNDCKEITQAACPFVPVPSSIRGALARL